MLQVFFYVSLGIGDIGSFIESFIPNNWEKLFVFDFGGGTTDFDFGVFYEADEKKSTRYDYTIEHFGAGGDRYLGGENLLELLAFEVFKKDKRASFL